MHWESFYIKPKYVQGNELTFPEEEAHHLSRVLRKKKGDIVWVVDGEGTAYEVEILYITRNDARGRIIHTRRRIGEPVAEVTLAQGILKGERYEWLVEKATEIGVRRIIPFNSENSATVAGPQKLARWKRVAVAAMKQSGRSILPEIVPSKTFKQVITMGADCHHRLIAHAGPKSVALRIPENTRPIVTPKALLITGPEGGFTEEEVNEATEHGFQSITLGPRRLRAETAGIILSTLLLSHLGEFE